MQRQFQFIYAKVYSSFEKELIVNKEVIMDFKGRFENKNIF